LIVNKLRKAGFSEEHAAEIAEVLVYADARGYHSHGAIRVEYYAERAVMGGINTRPQFSFERTGPCTGIFHGDNAAGQVAAKRAMVKAVEIAKESGIACVGVRRISHSGALGYFVQQAAEEGLIGISVCQADPMVVPYGGSGPFYGSNPIAFSVKGDNGKFITFDMATAGKSWGKILEARANKREIPDPWAVDRHGNPTADPYQVRGLLPAAGPKGFGLAMMVDILSGILLGLPFGRFVSPLYGDLTKNRDLGQLHLVVNPAFFTDAEAFRRNITRTMEELNNMKPAGGFDRVAYPGQGSAERAAESEKHGIEIADEVYEYLVSDAVHRGRYHHYDPFAD